MMVWSKVAVARVREPPADVWKEAGEVTNNPTWTVTGSPVRCAVPIRVHVVPLVES
jgi:hypothetical protein